MKQCTIDESSLVKTVITGAILKFKKKVLTIKLN